MRKKTILILSMLGALSMAFTLSGCQGCDKEDGDMSISSTLSQGAQNEVNQQLQAMANLRIESDAIVWQDIVNAKTYAISINGGAETVFRAGDSLAYNFPKTVGEYVAKLSVKGDGVVNFSTEISYKVANLIAEKPVVFANSVKFDEGISVYYRISSEDNWKKMNGANYLDFNSLTAGTSVAFEYYVEGKGYDESTKTYYIDSVATRETFTIKHMLNSVALSLTDGQLVWNAVEGASGYVVNVDGTDTTVQTTSCALAKTLGEHTITVYPLPADEESYTAGNKADIIYCVEAQSVETFSLTDDDVVFAEKYADCLYYKMNLEADWSMASATTLQRSGLSVKLAERYDEATRTLYLESKPLQFTAGNAVQVEFDKTGKILCDLDGEGLVNYKLYTGNEPSEFSATSFQEFDLLNCEAGVNYTFKCKLVDGIRKEKTIDYYVENPLRELNFYVLPTPELSQDNEKLVWTMDEKAAAYAYGTDIQNLTSVEGTDNVTLSGSLQKYYVQAIGSDEGFVVNSKASSIYVDPSLQMTLNKKQTHSFGSEGYLELLSQAGYGNFTTSASFSIVDGSASEAEQAIVGASGADKVLKVVAGNTPPKSNLDSGNYDGVSAQFLQSIPFENQLSMEYYLYIDVDRVDEINVAIAIAGKSVTGQSKFREHWLTLPTQQWVKYSVNMNNDGYYGGGDFEAFLELYSTEIKFQGTGLEGDTIYISSIEMISSSAVDTDTLKGGYIFNTEDSIYSLKVKNNAVEPTFDSENNCATIALDGKTSGYGNAKVELLIDENCKLQKGDKFEITYASNVSWGAYLMNKYNGVASSNGEKTTVILTVTDETKLGEAITFYTEGWSAGEWLKLYSFKLIRQSLTEAELLAGVAFDSEESLNALSVKQNADLPTLDSEKGCAVIQLGGKTSGYGNPRIEVLVENVILHEGDIVEIVYEATAGCGVYFLDSYNGLSVTTQQTTKTLTVSAEKDGSAFSLYTDGWTNNENLYLYSIKLIRTED